MSATVSIDHNAAANEASSNTTPISGSMSMTVNSPSSGHDSRSLTPLINLTDSTYSPSFSDLQDIDIDFDETDAILKNLDLRPPEVISSDIGHSSTAATFSSASHCTSLSLAPNTSVSINQTVVNPPLTATNTVTQSQATSWGQTASWTPNLNRQETPSKSFLYSNHVFNKMLINNVTMVTRLDFII